MDRSYTVIKEAKYIIIFHQMAVRNYQKKLNIETMILFHQSRGTERIVVGSDGAVWYINDHYHTVTQIE